MIFLIKHTQKGDSRLLTIEDFVEELASFSDKNRLVTNPYKYKKCRYNLLHYLQHLKKNRIDIMFIGEAPSHRGCLLTGIPFTDEIQLRCKANCYAIGYWKRKDARIYKRRTTVELSATKVWAMMREYKIIPLLWNAFPFHPFKEGNKNSNRTPNRNEFEEGLEYIYELKDIFEIDNSQIFAVGKKAKSLLEQDRKLQIDDSHCIRHPANDYKAEFGQQFEDKIVKYLNR